MDFLSKLVWLYLGLSLLGCGASSRVREPLIGQPIGGSSLNTLMSPGSSKFYAFDSYSRSMLYIDAAEGKLDFSDQLDESFQESFWLPSEDQRYAFVIEGRYVRMKSPITEPAVDILRLGDSIFSYAALPAEGLYAFVDVNFSISLVQVDATGKVLKQWVGGPLLSSGQKITVGDMLSGGKLLLGLDSKELILVDCLASLEAQSWVYQTQPALSDRILWIAPIREQTDRALIETMSAFHLYDVKTATVVSSLSLDIQKSSLFGSKKGTAHLGYKDFAKGTVNLVYPKGDSFATLPLPASLGDPVSSYLSSEFLLAQSSQEKALKIRLSDALVQSSLNLGSDTRVGLSEQGAVAVYDSPLGYIEIHRFDSDEPRILKGFNRKRLLD